jgi:hypothetical protein
VNEHATVPAVDIAHGLLDGLVVVRLAVRKQHDQDLVVADRLADRLRQALEVLRGLGGGGALSLAGLRLLGGRLRAGRRLPGVDPVDALLLRELAVGGVDGILGRVAHLAGLADGRARRLHGRDLLGLGPEEEHVGAQRRDGEDEHDSDRRGDLAHDHAYRHVSREG